MKKVIALILSAVMLLSVSAVCAYADSDPSEEADSVTVFVTIADESGATVVAAEKLTVADLDADTAITINDALYLAHDTFYVGGAAAGYGASVSQYGLGLTKLWGSTCGSYGYYVNNQSAWALSDPIKDGDHIVAFIYTDTVGWSDHYSGFDCVRGTYDDGEAITLTYSEVAFDEQWNPVSVPVEGAVITIDGTATEILTDAEGKATFTLSGEGSHTVSATAEGKRLVAPIFIGTRKLIGDADEDGKVTVLDATRIQRWLAAMVADVNVNFVNGDADHDDSVTILDATRIQRYLANIITEM